MTAQDRLTPTAQLTVTDYIEAVAAGTPAPGGGSVCAIVGALAAALGSMVSRLTLKRYPDQEETFNAAITTIDEARAALVQLSSDDETAYGQYIIATRLPKSTDEEKTVRKAAQQDALVVATEVPLAVAQRCLEVVEALQPVAEHGQKNILPDAAVGAWLAVAASKGALLNIQSNTGMLTDKTRADAFQTKAEDIERSIHDGAERVHAVIKQRV